MPLRYLVKRQPRSLLTKRRRITDCDKHLGPPLQRELQTFDNHLGAEQRCTHDAGAETLGMRREQQILRRHGRALYGHQILGVLS